MISTLLDRLFAKRPAPATPISTPSPAQAPAAPAPATPVAGTPMPASLIVQSPPRPVEVIPQGAVLTDAAIARVARRLDIEPAAIWAVAQVESGGKGGFLPDKRPRILYEAHIFSKLTGRRFDGSHPTLSRPRWDRTLYRGGVKEYDRLAAAMELDRDAALQSCSWGKFQILGTNHRICGYPTIQDFVDAMRRSEEEHLNAFMEFVRHRRLDDELREHRWADFAFGYNGARFKENRYDTKLEMAYLAAKRARAA